MILMSSMCRLKQFSAASNHQSQCSESKQRITGGFRNDGYAIDHDQIVCCERGVEERKV